MREVLAPCLSVGSAAKRIRRSACSFFWYQLSSLFGAKPSGRGIHLWSLGTLRKTSSLHRLFHLFPPLCLSQSIVGKFGQDSWEGWKCNQWKQNEKHKSNQQKMSNSFVICSILDQFCYSDLHGSCQCRRQVMGLWDRWQWLLPIFLVMAGSIQELHLLTFRQAPDVILPAWHCLVMLRVLAMGIHGGLLDVCNHRCCLLRWTPGKCCMGSIWFHCQPTSVSIKRGGWTPAMSINAAWTCPQTSTQSPSNHDRKDRAVRGLAVVVL